MTRKRVEYNKRVYGRDFAAVYDDKFAHWGGRMWPFLQEQVEKHRGGATGSSRERRAAGAVAWLDLCCGAGSLLKLVCAHGYSATGVDCSAHQLCFARRNAPKATLVRQDIRDLALPRRFDVVTCVYDSLNYLTSKRDVVRALCRVRRHLDAGGVFIFDINTFEGLEDRWNRVRRIDSHGTTLICEFLFDAHTGLGHLYITGFVRSGRLYRRFEEHHVERGYRVGEMDALLRRAGFVFKKLDCRTLGRPRKRSGRLVYVCRHERGGTRRGRWTGIG